MWAAAEKFKKFLPIRKIVRKKLLQAKLKVGAMDYGRNGSVPRSLQVIDTSRLECKEEKQELPCPMPRIRVLVVDNSAASRRLISESLSAEPTIEVVGVAANGSVADEVAQRKFVTAASRKKSVKI
jgi:PleD family two-component response regulator